MTQAKLDHYLKEVYVAFCSCNKYLERGRWKPFKTIKEVVSKKIRKQLPRARLEFEDFVLPEVPNEEVENEVVARAGRTEHVVRVTLKMAKCNLCEKEGTEYYEAILQVRSTSTDVLETSVELLQRKVEKLRHKGVFINKVKKLNDGYNLYLTNKRVAQALGRELHNTYGGVFKTSPHLHTRDKQKSINVYRVNVFVRLPGFEKGDIITDSNDNVFRVEKLGKKIKLLDLEKNSTRNIDYNKLSYHLLKPYKTYVSRIEPQLEVIDPLDYQSSLVKSKHVEKLELGQEIHVVVHKGLYVVD